MISTDSSPPPYHPSTQPSLFRLPLLSHSLLFPTPPPRDPLLPLRLDPSPPLFFFLTLSTQIIFYNNFSALLSALDGQPVWPEDGETVPAVYRARGQRGVAEFAAREEVVTHFGWVCGKEEGEERGGGV